MTTICTDGITMAADGQTSDRGTIVTLTRAKMRRLADGSIAGFCGASALQGPVFDWLDGVGRKPTVTEDDGVAALVLHPGGLVTCYDWHLEPMAIAAPAAIGSGMDFALAALDLGATTAQAIGVAAARCCHTGGTISVMAPSQPEGPLP